MAYFNKANPEQKFQTTIVTNVYAINPNQANPFHICTMYSPTMQKAVNKKSKVYKEIHNGRYLQWAGNDRRDNVTRALRNNWEIRVENYSKLNSI